MLNIRRVAVAISGGVDSAVTAGLLKKKGYELEGVFMRNWDITDEFGVCSVSDDIEDAKFVCNKFNIPFREINFVKQYWNDVFTNFVSDYENGLTPNPDIDCNKHIKFNLFFNYAIDTLQADAIATGHYAKTSFGSFLNEYESNRNVKLLKPEDDFKDQTFFLSQVPQVALRKTMFPLGTFHKSEVKEMALQFGLEKIVKKRESTGICFIGFRNFQNFISDYVLPKPGDLIDISTGELLGLHDGIHLWTIGQRYPICGKVSRYFVAYKNLEKNCIFLAPGTDHPSLFTKLMYTTKPYWIDNSISLKPFDYLHCDFRFQHTKPLIPCNVLATESGELIIFLEKPAKALTPGQYAVLYKDEECLGSARILRPGPSYLALGLKVPSNYEEYQHNPRTFMKKEVENINTS